MPVEGRMNLQVGSETGGAALNSKVQVFRGTLKVEGRRCYLAPAANAKRSVLLFLSVPTGAAFFEGFAAATDFFLNSMKKKSGECISVRGVRSKIENIPVIEFLPQELGESPDKPKTGRPLKGDEMADNETGEQRQGPS